MIRQRLHCVALLAFVSTAYSQPFHTIINIPPTSPQSLPDDGGFAVVGPGVQVNVTDRPTSGFLAGFVVEAGGELNYSLSNDSEIADFRGRGGTINLLEGTIPFWTGEGEFNVSGGLVGNFVGSGGSITLSDGRIDAFSLGRGVGLIKGGFIREFAIGLTGDPSLPGEVEVTVMGGEFEGLGSYDVGDLATLNVLGGDLSDAAWSIAGTVNFFGSAFAIDGVPLDLEAGMPLIVPDRDVILSGLLEDGTPFALSLITSGLPSGGEALVEPGATITVTLMIPEPTAACLATLAAACGLRRASTRRR